MLQNSFIFLDKVGLNKERQIRSQVRDWNEFLKTKRVFGISDGQKFRHNKMVNHVKQAYNEDRMDFLAKMFPYQEHWRLYEAYKNEALFLDIETYRTYGNITVVGLYDGNETKMLVKGFNLDRKTLAHALRGCKLIVTYNGRSFDVPILKRYFQMPFDMPHIDLRGVCSRVGLTGGLKAIEKKLGIKRPSSIKHVTGNDAAELWRCWHATGDKDYLDMLLTYNEEDCVNLQTIADIVIPQLWQKTINTS